MSELNKFEKTKLLSSRALEIANGAKPKVKVSKEAILNKDYVNIAQQEFDEGKLELELYHKK